jgi:hypothetical protein
MGLFTPIWKSKNEKRALRAVRKMTDQKKLEMIIKEDERRDIRIAAVKNLTNQTLLANIVKNDDDWDVRRVAVERLFAPDKLKDVVEYFSNINISNVENNASILIPIAKKFPQVMKENWKQIENRITTLHKDIHDDIACYSERISITAASLGVVFPPYPFDD